jgi:uncharacterized protein YkwD
VLANPPNKSHKKTILTVVIILIVVGAVLFAAVNSGILNLSPASNQSGTTNAPTPQPTVPNTQPTLTANSSGSSLVNYALELINLDRQANGLGNVTLSPVNSAQVHADDMLKNSYFSHWDLNGYKPPVRYTVAGGRGAVEENMAWRGVTGVFASVDVKSSLKDLEHSMMYDDASSDWAHRDNILTASHNRVSIGIASDSKNVYLVQDFEDDYVTWSQLSYTGGVVTMQGTISREGTIQQVAIFYDNASCLTASQLGQAPYNSGYNPGTLVGLVLPSGYVSQEGVTVTASTWTLNGTSFDISFPMNQAVEAHGNGVYTLYLETGSSTTDSLTTYSLIVK